MLLVAFISSSDAAKAGTGDHSATSINADASVLLLWLLASSPFAAADASVVVLLLLSVMSRRKMAEWAMV